MFKRKFKLHRIASSKRTLLAELSPTKPKPMRVGGKEVMICRTDEDEIVALHDRCPHAGKRLSDGWCEQGRVICPYHRYSFDLKTGMGSGTGVDTYEVVETEEGLFLSIPGWSLF